LHHLSTISLRRNGLIPEIILIWHFHFLRKNPIAHPHGFVTCFCCIFWYALSPIKVPNKFSSTFCFSPKTRERLQLWCVCVSVYACYCLFISGFSRRNTFAKKDGWVNFVGQHEYFNFSQRHMNIKRRIIFQTILGFFSNTKQRQGKQFCGHIQKKYAQGADNVTTSDTDVLCKMYRTLHLTRKQLCTPPTTPRI
jgi:hypothetical protein